MIITGVPSGDLECWCFNVTAEDFKRVTGKEPDEWDQARFPKGEYKYALYPCHLIPQPDDQKGKPITVCIESNITVPVVEKRKGEKDGFTTADGTSGMENW